MPDVVLIIHLAIVFVSILKRCHDKYHHKVNNNKDIDKISIVFTDLDDRFKKIEFIIDDKMVNHLGFAWILRSFC
mgnify:CR=1 FL=1